jgi:hypothetical protein
MAYGKYRHSQIKGEAGTTWYVEIWKKDFDQPGDTSTEMDLAGEGFEIKWTGEGGTRDRQFLTSECIISLYAQNNNDESFIYDVFEKGDKEYFVRIYKNYVSVVNLWWFGWVQPSFDTLSNEPYPYPVKIIATDSIGVYKSRAEDILTSSNWNQPDRIINHINDFGNTMSLFDHTSVNLSPIPQNHKWYKTSVDWWRDGDTYQSNDPFYLYYITAGAYRKNIEKKPFNYKKYDVFRGCMKTFNTVGFLSDGAYNFIQPNNLADNVTGDIRMYPYLGSNDEVPSSGVGDVTTLLEIDQTQNANKGTILAGSTITYEPLFKSVKLDFINGNAAFNVPEGVNLQSPFTAGQLQAADADIGYLGLTFSALHYETFSFTPATGRSLENWAIRTIGTLKIKIGTGSDTRWLKVVGLGFEWFSTEQSIELQRGRNIYSTTPPNNSTYGMATSSDLSNENENPNDAYPCNIEYDSSTSTYTARTRLMFQTLTGIPIPQVSGDITIELDCTNQYWQYQDGATTEYISANPSSVTKSTVSDQIYMNSNDTNSLDGEVGLTYQTSQDVNDAYETYDLGEVVTGCTQASSTNFSNTIFSVKYKSGSNYLVASQGFTRGNSTSFSNISQLLTKEFLELQTEPLEILQADIFSPDISPLKLVKYSINNDGNDKYYSFLGGTFKAQSETMSGEWFKIETGLTVTPEEPTEVLEQSFRPTTDVLTESIRFNSDLISEEKSNNAYGSLASTLPENTSDTKVTLASASKGKIYNGQKLLLCYPDGRHPLTLTASGDSTTSDTQITLASFTPDKDYPAGSLLVPLTYDLTNVITGGGGTTSPGGSDTQVQFNDNGSFGGTSLMTVGTDKITFTGNVEIQGSNEKIKLNSGGDIVIDDDVNGGSGSGGLLYRDSGGSLKFAFVVHPSNIVTICNRAANGEVQIRANTSTAGASGELTIATFKDTSVDFRSLSEIRASNIGNIFDTEAYLTAVDFTMSTHEDKSGYSRTNGATAQINNSAASLFASFQVPLGYQATHVQVYGSSTSSTFDVYLCNASDATVTSLTSSPSVGTNQALSTAQEGAQGRYLSIKFTPGSTSRTVYGAKITLARV